MKGALFALYVVELGVVAKAEGDALLQSVSDGELLTEEARWFWMELVGTKEAKMSMQDMEGYQELMDKLLESLPAEQRLAGLPAEQVLSHYAAEQRLAGLSAEQRLAGLDRDHQVLALPLELLRQLSETYLLSLPPEVQAEVRRRLAQTGD